jgi:hypothetical protein
MALLRGLLDRAVLIAGVLAGGMVPGFLAQYRQRVGGALGQALKDLAPFQAIADRFHGGSLDKLIAHHLASTDPTFHAEGAAIRAIVDSAASLKASYAALDTDVFHQLAYVLRAGDPAMLQATWTAHRPTMGLDLDSLVMAGVVGLSCWLAFLAVWWAVAALAARARGTPVPPRGLRARR